MIVNLHKRVPPALLERSMGTGPFPWRRPALASKINYQIEMEREPVRIAQRGEIGRRYEIVNLHKRVPPALLERSMGTIPLEEAGAGEQDQPSN